MDHSGLRYALAVVILIVACLLGRAFLADGISQNRWGYVSFLGVQSPPGGGSWEIVLGALTWLIGMVGAVLAILHGRGYRNGPNLLGGILLAFYLVAVGASIALAWSTASPQSTPQSFSLSVDRSDWAAVMAFVNGSSNRTSTGQIAFPTGASLIWFNLCENDEAWKGPIPEWVGQSSTHMTFRLHLSGAQARNAELALHRNGCSSDVKGDYEAAATASNIAEELDATRSQFS